MPQDYSRVELKIPDELLDEIDNCARHAGLRRAAWIKDACQAACRRGSRFGIDIAKLTDEDAALLFLELLNYHEDVLEGSSTITRRVRKGDSKCEPQNEN